MSGTISKHTNPRKHVEIAFPITHQGSLISHLANALKDVAQCVVDDVIPSAIHKAEEIKKLGNHIGQYFSGSDDKEPKLQPVPVKPSAVQNTRQ